MYHFRFPLACLALFSICSTAAAQYTPTQPDNTLTPADPIGVPPEPSKAGTHEAVSNTNGGLSFFLPVLALPQRGGWNLTLGLYNTSPNWSTRTDSSTQITNQAGGAPTLTNITYTSNIVLFSAGGPLNWNTPTLQASIEYAGQFGITQSSPDGTVYVPVVCITNWVFTDWSGNRHSFTNVTECSAISEPLAQVTDSSDGSWLRLDTTNYHSDITVRTKDGAIYHFPGWPTSGDPFASCNTGMSCYGQYGAGPAPTNGNFYNRTFSSMVDSTGQNTVTNNGSALTDTIGRTITFLSNGISYKDANGNSQTIQVTQTKQATQAYHFSLTCSQGKFVPNLSVGETYGPMTFNESPSTYTVTLPPVNGVSRVYTMQFDGLGNLLQVNYPAGGYTKYDYQDFTFFSVANVQTCSRTEHQVFHRRECPLSSGACSGSQELVTTYTPGPDGTLPFNDSMGVQDPLGNLTYVQHQNLAGYPFVVPHETTRQIFPPGQYPNGTPLRTIQTTYTPLAPAPGVDISVPASVTTTLNDVSPALSSVTNYQYQTVTMTFHCFSGCSSWTAQVFINNATEIDEFDYGASSPTRKTAQTWMNQSNGPLYDIAGSHLLDRLSTRTITDPVSNVQSTLGYGYNSIGDITSKTVGGTNVSTLTTNYQRDAYGNMTQLTDPKGNLTKFGYTDSWGQTTCAPSSNSSAYLTSITDALNHITNFSYNSCTGSKASATDPNNAKTSFSYDALGRPTQMSSPDGGKTTSTYVDSVPNSVTVSKLVNSSTNSQLQTKTILDGFNRTTQTQLVSDPDGTTYTDTTYDRLGRKATVSNPYRTANDAGPTNGTTSYFYDALSRACLVVPPDGTLPSGNACPATRPANTIFTAYSGNTTTVSDQAGKTRKSVADALGRMTQVTEDPGGLAYVTSYGYDAFGSLTSVVQNGSRQRNFLYDAFSRLTSAANPESGTITYGYDADSNLVTKTSPAPNQTGSATISIGYSYDALNRLTAKTYSDASLPVSYFFDGQTPPSAPSSGTGTVTINGSEQSTAATYATGTITISSVSSFPTQTVTVGTSSCRFNFARGTPPSNAATAVANCLNGTGLVTAHAINTTISLTSIVAGTAGNYALSWSGFSGSISGMSGGTDGTPDAGTVSVTVNGFTQTVNYGGGSTGSSIASALFSAFNVNSSSPVTASVSNNVLTLTAKAAGSTSNYSLSAISTYDTTHFSSPSFTSAAFGFTLTGGCSADSVTVTNGIGRRTGMCDPAGAEAWTYDPMGRVLTDQRNTNGIIKTATYSYQPYVDGSLYQLTYPTGRAVTYTTNTAARLLSAVDQANSINYATGAHYSPAGALAALTNGSGTGIASVFIFNSRLQPCWVYAATGTALPWNTTNCTSSAPTGTLLDLKYNFNLGSGDNGNVIGITNNINPNRSQNFTYDSLNRIFTAQTTSTYASSPSNCWAETYTYDPWGSLYQFGANTTTQSAYVGCSQESGLTTQATTKNQLAGYCYDAAGNLVLNATCPTGSFTPTYSYNAENQLSSTAGVSYTYDGDGRRVTKSGGTIYWYGEGSEPLDETDLTGSFSNSSFHEYVFFGGKRIARRDSVNNVQYYFADHLGSARVVTNTSGSILDNSDFYPFGGERIITSSSGNHYKFTSKERDPESGLDDFDARYYSSQLGRFMSADWSAIPDPIPYANLTNPQTLNLYAMVRDNPETFVDLDGHFLSGSMIPVSEDDKSGTNCGADGACVLAQMQAQQAAQAQAQQAAQNQNQDQTQQNQQPTNQNQEKKQDQEKDQQKTPLDAGSGSGGGRQPRGGERGKTSKPDNPWKHTRPSKDHPGQYEVQDHQTGKWVLKPKGWSPATQRVILGVEVGVTAYVIYRVVRMLPSLAPPLWETIPLNAALP